MLITILVSCTALVAPLAAQDEEIAVDAAGFAAWVQGFRPRARAEGITQGTLEAALAGIAPNATVIRRDRNQNEFSRTLWDYLDLAVSEARIANGRRAMDRQGALLADLEERYGVDAEIVAAIWGLESAYGAVRGDIPTVEALATLAHDGRRGAFFERQLIDALRIIQSGDTGPENMVGSWAGAMGHTQFLPSSYLDFAVDHNGDGRRDIWGDDPTDALASTAAYLAENGWVRGVPWGLEVVLPAEFDYRAARRDNLKLPSQWAEIGITDINGVPVPDHGRASILLPAGYRGAAFMIFENFRVLETYNTADSYVIAVGHLADRIAGGPAIRSDWPYEDRALTFDERTELQVRLTEAGFDTRGIDGLVGPLTVNAIRNYQDANGLVPDGYASPGLLERLRGG